MTPVLFLAAMPAILAHGAAPLPVLASGVFLGSFYWWIVLNTAVSLFRRSVTSHVLNQMNKVAGLLLALMALSLLVRGLEGSIVGRWDGAGRAGAIGATGQAADRP